MVKSVLAVNHQGLRDWVIQRLSAVLMTVATVGLVVYFLTHPKLSFVEWRMLFSSPLIKVLTILVTLSLVFHAWVGIWTVLTDYVKPALLRFALEVLVFLSLLACFIWSLLIVWGF